MLRNLLGFGLPLLIAVASVRLMPGYLTDNLGWLWFSGVIYISSLWLFSFLLYEPIYTLFHPKPDVPKYAIFRYWGSTAPIEYRIERNYSLDLVAYGDTFLPKVRWVARYVAVPDTELTGHSPWDKIVKVNKFTSESEAEQALIDMLAIHNKKEQELAAKLKPGPVAACWTPTGKTVSWDSNVEYVS